MPRIVLFGAGSIGRSFIGQVFAQNGYEVVFVDIDERIIDALNRRGGYDVVIKHPEGAEETLRVSGVRAVDARDTDRVSEELVGTDLAATAVGAGALPSVAGLIRLGLLARRANGSQTPLDVILAENVRDAATLVADVVGAGTAVQRKELLDSIGLVRTSIGKMVPIVPADVAARDPLVVFAEPYNTLIVDAHGFRNRVPDLPQIKAVDDIRAYVDRKLFVHNLGHAAVSYVGFRTVPAVTSIAEAVGIESVRAAARDAMSEAASALTAEYPGNFSIAELHEHRDDLLRRFANRALGDTVYRVGRDLPRKLSRDERVVGAMLLAARLGLDFTAIADVYRAALGFRATDDAGNPFPQDEHVVTLARSEGTEAVLTGVSGLRHGEEPDEQVIATVLARGRRA